ncbi:MAG: NDP-sugar synthase [Deltaproteobacteria bacterium]|nr:NDP-sugar synthase [Deltaproteobacteria bacterium]
MPGHVPRVAFVLAAGKGTRLAPLTDERPKPLVEVMGIPLVEIALRHALRAGVSCAVINTHHLHPQVQENLGNHFGSLPILYSHEEVLLGTGGGFKRMHAVLKEQAPDFQDGPFLALNADAFADVDVNALVLEHEKAAKAHHATGTLLLKEVPDAKKYGVIGTDQRGRIVNFAGRAQLEEPATHERMFCGIHVFIRALLERLPDGPYDEGGMCVNREGYPKAMDDDEWLQGAATEGYFQDVGTKERLLQTHLDIMGKQVLQHLQLTNDLDERAPGVWIHPDAQVSTSAIFQAPVVVRKAKIDDDVVLGPFVVVGDECIVGRGAKINHSILQSKARVPTDASLAFAVLGKSLQMNVDKNELDFGRC